MIVRAENVVDAGVSAKLLSGCMGEFAVGPLQRMERARRYYDGEHAIMSRRKPGGAPNNQIVVPFPKYAVTIASGYLVGSPVQYSCGTDDAALEIVTDAFSAVSVDSVDMEIARAASIYGLGVEIVYFNRDVRVRVAALDPRKAFVVYDDTVEHRPIMGVHWHETIGEDGNASGIVCDVYTARDVHRFQGADIRSLVEVDSKPNPFGRVPVVEYWNNADECGDFDDEIPMIDAYDALQSDRVNDKQQFADSLLVFTGVGEVLPPVGADDGRSVGQRLREDKALTLPDRDAKVEWLTKSVNEADTQVLADALRVDIHKFLMIPDLSDRNFAGNASGVAIRYSLFGLEQLTKIKERWFREGLRERLRLFAAGLAMLGSARLDAEAVQITFTRSMPVNELELAQEVQTLRGIVPDQILLTRLPFVADAAAALEMLERQRGG